MKSYLIEAELLLPRGREEVFPFFGDARNLEKLTPEWLKFEVLTPSPIAMHPGTLIDYKIKVHGLPIKWRTEIREWDPPRKFMDVQLRGPYKLWEHTHTFEERSGGTLCRDVVRYRPIGGWLINALFVRQDVKRIFEFRQKKLLEIFNVSGAVVSKVRVR